MSHFIATVDPSPARRAQFVQRAKRELSSFYGSPAHSFERADMVAVSWTQTWEPFGSTVSAQGVAFVWGNAMQRNQHVSQPPDLAELWCALPHNMPLPLEGIHAAFLYRADGSWIASADIFGTMPVYYCRGQDYVIVGSTPELFRTHPSFQARLNPTGLVGILLTNGLVDGHTLLQGVSRLGAGNLLYGCPDRPPQELTQYRPEVSDRYFGAAYEDNFDRMQAVLQDCFARHLSVDRSYGLILSGGLDSRLVAGTTNQQGITFSGLSFGSPNDIEMQCAVAVAKSLDMHHRILPVRMQHFVDYAENECKWKHLASGFSGLNFYEPIPDCTQIQGGMLSGYRMECVIGGDQISWAGKHPDEMCFDTLFKRINRWGMPVQLIKRLLTKICSAELIEEVKKRLEQTYQNYAEREFQRPWLFDFYHRARYHTSAVLGLHSRWPWPVVPYIDTQMLDLMGGMPYEHVKERRMQYHLLKRRFPTLARLPLDRNAFNMKPLLPRYGQQTDRVLYKLREIYYRWTQSSNERRIYYRVFDFNSPGWNTVRAAAESYRKTALQVLDETTLAEILPPPGKQVTVRDGIIDSSQMKLLTGFLLWSRTYL
jgi:asparagine synthase (glutamine-hydrolysing)